MTYQVHITKTAERDLISAADHIEFVLKNPKAADDLLDETDAQINSLVNILNDAKWLTILCLILGEFVTSSSKTILLFSSLTKRKKK